MKTIILNGSPKKNINESNTEIFINEFMKNMKEKCTVKYIIREDNVKLAKALGDYDNILIFLPLYIHAMPGSVMKFIEHLDKQILSGKNLGFFIQAGFPETAQEQFVENYFKELSKQLNCNYLGTVSKGQAAGVYMFPTKFKKLYKELNDLGRYFEENNSFDKNIVSKISFPYNLEDYPFYMKSLLKLAYMLHLDNYGWNMMLKQNKAFDKRFDKPFL